jgi:hypothetical protein
MKAITFELNFFSNDNRYMLLLSTMKNHKNVRVHEDGRITICLTEDDIETLAKLPEIYRDINNLNIKKK